MTKADGVLAARWLPRCGTDGTQPATHHPCSPSGRRDPQVTLMAVETLMPPSALSWSGSDFQAMPFGKLSSGS